MQQEDQASGHLVVIGASAGGLAAISEILGKLPAEFPAPILYVSHMARNQTSHLPEILSRRTRLASHTIEDGVSLQPGSLYIAPPDHMVTVEGSNLRITPCTGEVRFCPSIDMAISSAAKSYQEKSIAVILTGMLDDGVKGLQENYRCGGTTLIQSPEEADCPSMPLQAITRDHPDSVLSLALIAEKLMTLTGCDGAERSMSKRRT